MRRHPATLSDYQWLGSSEGRGLLAQFAGRADLTSGELDRLRWGYGTPRTRLLLAQLELRQRGQQKFSRADQMLFESVALEQATDERIALLKGSYVPRSARIADVGCGLGGDAIGLATHARVTGWERDPCLAWLAAQNAEVYERTGFVSRADPFGLDGLRQVDAWHADPDRRSSGERATSLASMAPDQATLESWLRFHPHALIKLAPATGLPESWKGRMECEWIGDRRECRQLLVRAGSLAENPGSRRATCVRQSEPEAVTLRGSGCERAAVRPEVSVYLVEPITTVIAAGLTDAFAIEQGAWRLSAGLDYLAKEAPCASPLGSCYRVLETLPLDRRAIRRWLQAHDRRVVEVKKRGVSVNPADWRRELRVAGNTPCVMIVMPYKSHVIAVMTAASWSDDR